jgi:hypothetical protein
MGTVRILKALFLLLALVLSAGCATSFYDWGEYEESVYRVTQGGFDVGEEIRELEDHLEQVHLKNRRVPPGYHAHLAYLHAEAGDLEAAARHLRAEKELFPEGSVFVDGTLARMSGSRR